MLGPTNDRISDPSILGQASCCPLNQFVVAVQMGFVWRYFSSAHSGRSVEYHCRDRVIPSSVKRVLPPQSGRDGVRVGQCFSALSRDQQSCYFKGKWLDTIVETVSDQSHRSRCAGDRQAVVASALRVRHFKRAALLRTLSEPNEHSRGAAWRTSSPSMFS